jgi:hypothetical protein
LVSVWEDEEKKEAGKKNWGLKNPQISDLSEYGRRVCRASLQLYGVSRAVFSWRDTWQFCCVYEAGDFYVRWPLVYSIISCRLGTQLKLDFHF